VELKEDFLQGIMLFPFFFLFFRRNTKNPFFPFFWAQNLWKNTNKALIIANSWHPHHYTDINSHNFPISISLTPIYNPQPVTALKNLLISNPKFPPNGYIFSFLGVNIADALYYPYKRPQTSYMVCFTDYYTQLLSIQFS